MHSRQLQFGIAMTALLSAFTPLRAHAQAVPSSSAARSLPTALSASDTVEVVREIDDPGTGNRWLLVRDWNRPGGPGRLLLLAGSPRLAQPAPASARSAAGESTFPAPAAPVIRAGDSLVVEESTPVVEARLAATALGPAAPGAAFEARLQIGGKIVRVRALAPGRARLEPGLAPEFEGQP